MGIDEHQHRSQKAGRRDAVRKTTDVDKSAETPLCRGTIHTSKRWPLLDEIWPIHPTAQWPEGLSLRREDMYAAEVT